MPKYLFIISFILFYGQFAFANKIDDLKTDKDIAQFVMTNTHSEGKWYEEKLFIEPTDSLLRRYKGCEAFDNSAKIKNWVKLDVNNDGLTDLLVFASGILRDDNGIETFQYLFVDKGNNRFSLSRIDRGENGSCSITTATNLKNRSLLLFYYMKALPLEKGMALYNQVQRPEKDTLTYKFGALLEYNPNPVTLEIDSVIFETGQCFGECPVYKIQFNKKGRARYHAGKYTEEPGDFKTIIQTRQLKQVFEVLNYIDINALDKEYAVAWTDDQPCWLTIKFVNGSVKKIHDYGMVGTFALRRLYKLLGDMRFNQTWTSTE